ncbi:hypothetical protein Tco_0646178 [Tanacetum coccineum]
MHIGRTLITACEPDDVSKVFGSGLCPNEILIDLLALDSIRGDDQAGVDTPIRVPYTDKQLLAMVRIGKQRGHIPGLLTQLGSQNEVGRGSEAWGMGGGGGGDYKSGGDEDADMDDDEGH